LHHPKQGVDWVSTPNRQVPGDQPFRRKAANFCPVDQDRLRVIFGEHSSNIIPLSVSDSQKLQNFCLQWVFC
jgi:hypothetical protein